VSKDSSENTILVVDDDPGIRTALNLTLEYLGYQVWLAESGPVALRMLEEKGCPFLILLDIMMPQMNGWEVLKAIRSQQQFSKVPVIVITAFHSQTLIPQNLTELLRKPIDIDQLIQILDKYRFQSQQRVSTH